MQSTSGCCFENTAIGFAAELDVRGVEDEQRRRWYLELCLEQPGEWICWRGKASGGAGWSLDMPGLRCLFYIQVEISTRQLDDTRVESRGGCLSWECKLGSREHAGGI